MILGLVARGKREERDLVTLLMETGEVIRNSASGEPLRYNYEPTMLGINLSLADYDI